MTAWSGLIKVKQILAVLKNFQDTVRNLSFSDLNARTTGLFLN